MMAVLRKCHNLPNKDSTPWYRTGEQERDLGLRRSQLERETKCSLTWFCWTKPPGDFKNGDSQAITWSTSNRHSSKKMKSFCSCPDRRLLLTMKQCILQSLTASTEIGGSQGFEKFFLGINLRRKKCQKCAYQRARESIIMRHFLKWMVWPESGVVLCCYCKMFLLKATQGEGTCFSSQEQATPIHSTYVKAIDTQNR